jgi:hypothetical protein
LQNYHSWLTGTAVLAALNWLRSRDAGSRPAPRVVAPNSATPIRAGWILPYSAFSQGATHDQANPVLARSACDEATQFSFSGFWIASLSLSSGGHSPDPLARNDAKFQRVAPVTGQ